MLNAPQTTVSCNQCVPSGRNPFYLFSCHAFIVKPRPPEASFIRAWFDSDHTSTSAVRAREAVS